MMKLPKMVLVVLVALPFISSAAKAGDFDWISSVNIQAEADPSGFRARLATRFKLGDVQIEAVLRSAERPADAYVFLRLGEMSRQSPEYVIEKYQANKGKGWGALAQSLGIKPGSEEFHALKRGQDLYGGGDDNGRDKGKVKDEGEGNGSGEGKGKGESKGKGRGRK